MLTTEKPIWQQDAHEHPIAPPQLPVGYILLTDAKPLLTVHDGRWIGRVCHPESGTEGVLLYEDAVEVAYLIADELVSLLSYLIREAEPLLDACDPQSDRHTMDHWWSLWWMEETRKARQLLAMSPIPHEQEVQI